MPDMAQENNLWVMDKGGTPLQTGDNLLKTGNGSCSLRLPNYPIRRLIA